MPRMVLRSSLLLATVAVLLVQGSIAERASAATAEAARSLAALYQAWGKPDRAAEWRAKTPVPSDSTIQPTSGPASGTSHSTEPEASEDGE